MDNLNVRSFISLIEEIDLESRSQRDRGTLFELLTKIYLENEPMYKRLFEEVWTLSMVPGKYNIPKSDTGVDLVAKRHVTGELVAIQCKYYSKDTKIRKYHIDSFLNEVGKHYYSEGLIVTTTDKWTENADYALKHRDKPIMRISLSQLMESRIDWSKYSFSEPKTVILKDKKTPRDYQEKAIESVVSGFKDADRGKLIMAPGTGKTFTSMTIAEEMAKSKTGSFRVLYLVPSIQLLSQTLISWNADTEFNMESIAVCSDSKVTKKKMGNQIEDIATADIGYPATTNPRKLLDYKKTIEKHNIEPEFITVFSTYQSIGVIREAQMNGFYDFDLVICDEAHRTTGSTDLSQEESSFKQVHSNSNIKAAKRLYQTATPRVYGEDAKLKAEESSVVIADMNDPLTYGEEFYRIGFGEAIRRGILSDYKVMVLAVEEEMIARRFQNMFSKEDSGLQFDDVTKIIGCWNGLVKRDGKTNKTLGRPMKRAIAFTGTIKDSKNITNMFSEVVDEYLYKDDDSKDHFSIDIKHADGTMNALEKNEKLDWLKSDAPDNTCRVLSNARFLTEGIDVPDLDAVMFLKPRRSEIDIAQAVGRVLRKAPNKEYGYIILPIGIPTGHEAHTVLDNHESYSVVWDILNALRSIDERFDATINKLELNKKKPKQIQIIGVGDAPEGGKLVGFEEEQLALDLSEENFTDLEKAIYGKIVKKVGNVKYWEQWSEDVAKIAQQHMLRINVMLEDTESHTYNEFQKFMKSIRYNINNSITEQQAIEMLAQHLITKPVFEALFETYSFVNSNPVSRSMESILDLLDKKGLVKEQENLKDFYESVRIRAEGIDNLKAKQEIIVQLYDKFFKVGFKETTDLLGIVFTPIEIVDFIINSVDEVLEKHFGKRLSSEGVHVLDPFTGTGTFITRLLQSGLISKEDLLRKYTQEIHANEIVLLSYYIAAINIEETFHSLSGNKYLPFEGIVLTDTFESTENKESFMGELFNENNQRLEKQLEQPIFAIIGNPPYSAGQSSDNDDNPNVEYPILDRRITNTYAKHTTAQMKKTLYDSYIRSFRWASDRIKSNGVIAFVTNGSFIDNQSTDGLRKCWYEDFNHIYVLNLRGNARTSGELRRKEAGNVFGSGTRTPIAITLLIKDGSKDHTIKYYEVADYLNEKEKLKKLDTLISIKNVPWNQIEPDNNNDWINQRDADYESSFISLQSEEEITVFYERLTGINTSRDAWVYGFNKQNVISNVNRMVNNYNDELFRLKDIKDAQLRLEKINRSQSYINWSRSLRNKFSKGENLNVTDGNIQLSMYRPFVKKWLYYDNSVIEMPGQYHRLELDGNPILATTGRGSKRNFSALVTNLYPNFHYMDTGQNYFLGKSNDEINLFGNEIITNVNDAFMKELNLKDDREALYYIYGIFHSPEYLEKYSNDLKKDIPRVPLLKNKEEFIKVGKELFDLHLNYEKLEPYDSIKIEFSSKPSYKVKRMKFKKIRDENNKLVNDTSSIIFNEDITITNIPNIAYEYVVNGKPAVHWIMEQYQIKEDSKSFIIDDPNDFSSDNKYIFKLLLSVINLSIITINAIQKIPKLEVINKNEN